MIKTVPLDIPINFFFGCFFSLLLRERIKKENLQGFSLPVIFAVIYSLWFGCCVSYFYVVYPDWMFAYIFDTKNISIPLTLPLFILSLAIASFSGSILTQNLIRKGKKFLPIAICIFSFIFYIALFALQWNEYFHVGTYSEYQNGNAIKFNAHTEIQKAFSFATPLMFIPLIIIVLFFIRDSLKIRKIRLSKV